MGVYFLILYNTDMKTFLAVALLVAVSASPAFNERQAQQLGTNVQNKLQQLAQQNGVGVDVNAKVQEAQAAIESLVAQYKQTHAAEIQQGKQQASRFKQQTVDQCRAARNCNTRISALAQQHRGTVEQQANNLVSQGSNQLRNL